MQAFARHGVHSRIDDRAQGEPGQVRLGGHLCDARGLHIHRISPTHLPQPRFGSHLYHYLADGDKIAQMIRQALQLGRRLELFDEHLVRWRPYLRCIWGHEPRGDDDGARWQVRIQASRKSQAHDSTWGVLRYELSRPLCGACASDANLSGHKRPRSSRIAIGDKGRGRRWLGLMIGTDEACGDLTRQGDDEPNAVQPDTPSVIVER